LGLIKKYWSKKRFFFSSSEVLMVRAVEMRTRMKQHYSVEFKTRQREKKEAEVIQKGI